LKSNGTVAAWGDNSQGQTDVPAGLSGVVQAAAGGYHSLAVKAEGTVVAWGYNSQGQCNVPPGLSGVARVAGGLKHSLAVKADGTVAAWGDNTYGQCNVPAGLSGVARVKAGDRYSLAVKTDGTVVAWGDNTFGQGNVPAGLSGVTQISAGGYHALALKSDGTVVAWGYSGFGGTSVPAGLSGVVHVAAGDYHSLAVKSDGTVVAWGYNNDGETNVPSGLSGVAQVAGGEVHSLALLAAAVDVDQGTMYAGGSATGSVSLVAAPGAGGATFALTSDDASVHVPDSVTIPEGGHLATFPVTTDVDFGGNGDVHVYAVREGKTYSATIHLVGETAALALSQTSVVGGSTSKPVLTINLGGALSTDVTLALSSSDPRVNLPATVTVPAGQTSAKVTLAPPGLVSGSTPVTLSAAYDGKTVASTGLTLLPLKASISFDSNSVPSGTPVVGSVDLNVPVAHALTVALSSNNGSVMVPASATVKAGGRFATFPISTLPSATNASVAITVTVNGVSSSTSLKLLAVPGVKSLTLPTTMYGNGRVSGTVRLTMAAKAGGTVVALSSSNLSLTIPATVTVPEGQYSATFETTTSDVAALTNATVTASAGPSSATAGVAVKPLIITSFTVSPTTATSNTTVTLFIKLAAVAGVDTVVTLTSADPSIVSVPATVTIPAGSQTVTVSIPLGSIAVTKFVRITATKPGSSLYRTLKIAP
ncbi:hypothetical protein EON79_09670, partial [bacterium]